MRVSHVVIALLVLALGLGAWYVYRERTRTLRAALDLKVDLTVHGVDLRQGEAGREQWRLGAQSARYDQRVGTAILVMPDIRYYVGEDRQELRVHSEQGEVDQAQDTAHLWPEVRATLPPTSLRADELFYHGHDKTIELKGRVFMERDTMTLEAPRMELDITTKNVKADGGVQAVLKLNDTTLPGGPNQ